MKHIANRQNVISFDRVNPAHFSVKPLGKFPLFIESEYLYVSHRIMRSKWVSV